MENGLHNTAGFDDEDGEMDMDLESISTPSSVGSAKSLAFDTTTHVASLGGCFDSPSTPPCEIGKSQSITTSDGYLAKSVTIVSDNPQMLEPGVDEYVGRMKAGCRTLPPPRYKKHEDTRGKSSEDLHRRGIHDQDQGKERETSNSVSFTTASATAKRPVESTASPKLVSQLKTRVTEDIHWFQASFFDSDIDFSATNDNVPDFCLEDYRREDFTIYGAEQPDTKQNDLNSNSDFLAQDLPPLGSDFEYANYLYGENGSQAGSINGDEHSLKRPKTQREFERCFNKARFLEDKASSVGYAIRNGDVPPFNAAQSMRHILRAPGGWADERAEQNRKALEQGRKTYDKLFRQNLGIASITHRPNNRSVYDGSLKDRETLWDADLAGGFNADDREDGGDFEEGFGGSEEGGDSDATIYEEET